MRNCIAHDEVQVTPLEEVVPDTRILVVDDNEIVRDYHVGALRVAGYDAEAAADGDEALAIIASGGFGLMLTDLEMPRLGGIELIRALRAAGNHIPVVLISNSLGGDSPLPADIREEVAGALSKPARRSEILAAVGQALRVRPPVPAEKRSTANVLPNLCARTIPAI